jgi:hypothetical protein
MGGHFLTAGHFQLSTENTLSCLMGRHEGAVLDHVPEFWIGSTYPTAQKDREPLRERHIALCLDAKIITVEVFVVEFLDTLSSSF